MSAEAKFRCQVLEKICAEHNTTVADAGLMVCQGRKKVYVLEPGRVHSSSCFLREQPTSSFRRDEGDRPFLGATTVVPEGWKVACVVENNLWIGEVSYAQGDIARYQFSRLNDQGEVVEESKWHYTPSAAFRSTNSAEKSKSRQNGKLFLGVNYENPQQFLREKLAKTRDQVPEDARALFDEWLAIGETGSLPTTGSARSLSASNNNSVKQRRNKRGHSYSSVQSDEEHELHSVLSSNSLLSLGNNNNNNKKIRMVDELPSLRGEQGEEEISNHEPSLITSISKIKARGLVTPLKTSSSFLMQNTSPSAGGGLISPASSVSSAPPLLSPSHASLTSPRFVGNVTWSELEMVNYLSIICNQIINPQAVKAVFALIGAANRVTMEQFLELLQEMELFATLAHERIKNNNNSYDLASISRNGLVHNVKVSLFVQERIRLSNPFVLQSMTQTEFIRFITGLPRSWEVNGKIKATPTLPLPKSVNVFQPLPQQKQEASASPSFPPLSLGGGGLLSPFFLTSPPAFPSPPLQANKLTSI